MRERELFFRYSPCTTNFHDDGPATVAEAEARGVERCPYYDRCAATPGLLNEKTGAQCLLRFAADCVQMMHLERSRFAAQVQKFRDWRPTPAKGFIWSPDRQRFELIEDFDTAIAKLREFGLALMSGPASRQVTDLNDLVGTSMVDVGSGAPALSLSDMDEHAGNFGYNGGQGCDVLVGHCSCGANHNDGDKNTRF